MVGVSRWRSGIGAVILEASLRNQFNEPYLPSSVYIDWNQAKRTVSIDSPGLVRLESLLLQARSRANRDTMTEWLQECYERKAWNFESMDPPTAVSESFDGSLEVKRELSSMALERSS